MGQHGPLPRTIPYGGRLRRYTLYAYFRTVLVPGLHTSKLVPDIVAGGGSLGGGTLVDVLLASVIRDRNGMNGAAAVPGHSLEKAGCSTQSRGPRPGSGVAICARIPRRNWPNL
jgi:hypothetical protein